MKISELLPHKAIQAAEQAEQQTSSRDGSDSIAENFKRLLDQGKSQAAATGLDPLQARNNRDDEAFRNAMDRDATLKSQEHQEEYRPEDNRHQDREDIASRRDDNTPAREDTNRQDSRQRDTTDDNQPVEDNASQNTDSDNANTGDDTDSHADDAQTGEETASDTGTNDDSGTEDSGQPQTQSTTNANEPATDNSPQIAGIAAGTGLAAGQNNQQNTAGKTDQNIAAVDMPGAGKAEQKSADPAILQQQAMAARVDPNAQTATDAGDKQLSRTALAQAVRSQVQGQASQGDQGLAGQNADDGADADLQSLTQRSLAAEKGKAQQNAGQTTQQTKPTDITAQQNTAQMAAQKVDTAMDRLADAGRAASTVNRAGTEMSQGQATNQIQSNIAATATGQQSVDSAAKVVTLSTPRGAAHMPPTQQVAIHIAKGLEAGANKININLKPAELGRVEVQLEIAKDGGVAVRVTADRQETLDLMKQDSSSLEDALKEAGLDLNEEDMEFNLREDREGDLAKEENGDDEDAAAEDANGEDKGRELTPEETQAAIRQAILDRALDITV